MPLIAVPGVGQVQFPDDMPDDQIVAAIQRDILPKYGPATGGGSAGARGIDEAQGSLYSAVEGVGRASGIAGLERFGREGRVRNEAEAQASLPDSQRMSFEQAQSFGDYGRAGLQALGLSLPSSAGPLAGAAAGAALGSVVPGLGTGVGALIGGGLASLPQFYGSNRQRQIQETGDVQSEGRAFLAAVPQAAVESIADRVTLGLGRVLGLGADTVGRAVIPRIARGIGMQAASEVPTEVLQQALERGQAGLDVFSPDAMKEYKEAAIAAGVLGGTIGGTAAGAFGRRPEAPGEDQAKRDAELLAALEALRVPGALEGASEEDLRASARAAMLPNWETATAETLRAQLGRLLDQHNPSPDQTDEQRNTTRNMERDDLAAVRADEVETEERRRLAQRLIGARADSMTLDQLRKVTRAGTDGDLLTTAPSAAGQTDDQRDTVRNQEVYARQAAAAEAEERAALIAAVRGLRGSSISKERLAQLSLEDLRRMVGVGGETTTPPRVAPQAEAPQAGTPGTTPGGATVTNTQLQEMLDRIKELEATQSNAPPGAKPAQGLHSYDPATIGVDADTFQFKAGGDEHGVTDRLAGVRQWDPLKAGTALIYEYADGRRMIADGHQRLGLAKRLQAEGQQGIGLNAAVLRETDGYSPADARALAAAKNISEGTGSALDAAKVIRDVGEDSDIIKNLPPNSSMVRDAKGLAKLSPMAFGFVVNDLVPQGFAAQVGKHVSNPDRQVEVLEEMHRNPPGNALEAELMAKQVNSLLQETEYAAAQGGLFGGAGGTGQTRSLLIAERAKVLANAIATIRQNKQLFNTAIRGSKTLTRAGNTLDEDANRQLKSEGDRLLAYLEANANAKGPVSDALSQAARGYAENRSSRTLASVRDAFVASATEALHRESNGVWDVPGGTGQANPGRSAADGRGAELPASAAADTSQEVEAPAARIDDPNQGGFFSSREGGVTATAGTVSADAAKASQVVADRLAALRKMGKQGQAAAAAVEAALAGGKFSPQQLLAAFRIAESAARILGNRQLEVRFVPQILHNGIERQGQLAALSPDGTEGLMQFSLSPSSLAFARETGAHEAFHVAQALFAASDPKLLAALKAAFPEGGGIKGIDATLIRKLQTLRPRDSRRSYWDQLAADPAIRDEASSIELQAYVFGALDDARRNGQSLVGVKPALLRFANFLAELRQRLGAALKGDGFRSVGDVLSGVSGGTKLAGLSRAADIGQPFSSRGSPWASPTTSVPGQARPSTSSGASRTPTPRWSGTAPSPSSPEAASSTSPTTSSAAPAPGRSSSRTTGGLPLFDNQTRLDFGRQGFDPNAIKQIGGLDARVVGPISEGFFRIAEGAMLTLPFKVRQTLRDAGIKVTLGQKFADWNPVMAQQRPRGWMVGSTWAESEGAFDYDTQEILAFETRYDRGLGQQVVTTRPAGLIRHEAGHAFDHAEGLPSAFDQAFHKAWATDLARLPPAFRMADPYHNPLWYYVANSAGQLASRSESFAELMATAVASGRAGPNDTGPLGGSPNVNLADHMPLSANVMRDLARDQNQKTDRRGQGLLFSSRSPFEDMAGEPKKRDLDLETPTEHEKLVRGMIPYWEDRAARFEREGRTAEAAHAREQAEKTRQELARLEASDHRRFSREQERLRTMDPHDRNVMWAVEILEKQYGAPADVQQAEKWIARLQRNLPRQEERADAPDADEHTRARADATRIMLARLRKAATALRRADEGDFTPLFSSRGPVFFSALQRSVEGIQQKKAGGAEWAGMLRNLTQKGVKAEELAWTGVTDWLAEQKGPVSKDQVLDYIRINTPLVGEVVYENPTKGTSIEALQAARQATTDAQLKFWNAWARAAPRDFVTVDGENVYRDEVWPGLNRLNNSDPEAFARTLPTPLQEPALAMIRAMDAETAAQTAHQEDERRGRDAPRPRYPTMTLPGGQNYREMMLVLPERGDDYDNFKRSHFPETNVLAHVRFDERTDAEGNRVLFVAETQSDWHQKARRHGYHKDQQPRLEEIKRQKQALYARQRALQKQLEESGLEMGRAFKAAVDGASPEALRAMEQEIPNWGARIDRDFDPESRDFSAPLLSRVLRTVERDLGWGAPHRVETIMPVLAPARQIAEARETVQDALDASFAEGRGLTDDLMGIEENSVPDAPFRQSWPLVTMKQMLRYAAENGFDKLAWPSTPQQVAQVEQYGGHFKQEGDRFKVGSKDVTPIINRYIQDLPREMAKYVKKWGGKVETTGITASADKDYSLEGMQRLLDATTAAMEKADKDGDAPGKRMLDRIRMSLVLAVDDNDSARMDGIMYANETMLRRYIRDLDSLLKATPRLAPLNSITVTPAMRESVLQGQPLFSSRSRPADLAGDAAISKAYDATKGPGATPPRWYTKAMMGITGALPGESYKDALYRNSVNRAAPLYILDEMKKAQGLPDSRALGRMADRAFNATGRLEMVLEHGFIGYDAKSDRTFVRSDTPSVLGAFVGPDPKAPRVREAETDDFQGYLAMLRERDLLKSGRSGFKKLKPADVHAAIAAMESKRPAWKDAAADLHKINKAALEFGVATGILDPAKAKELAAIFYTPFYRQAEAEALSETAQGTTGPVTSSSLNNPHAFEKTVHESDSPIGNLFENLVKNYDFILRSGEKNVVLRATAEGMEKITNAAGQKLAERINYRRPGDKQVINLKIGGQSVMFKLNPDDKTAAATFLALIGLPTPVRGALFNAAASLAGVFRTGVTSLPSYMMANLWRGKIVAYAQEGLPFHTNTLQGMRQVYQASATLKDFAAETGFGGFTFGMGDKNVQAALSRKLRTEGGDATLWDRVSNLVAHLQKLSESTELADRLKLQERLIAQGKSVGEAAHQAYLLAPYSRKGLGGGLVGGTLMALTPLVPFLNSKVQGVARMFENDNQKRRIAGVPADIFLRGLMLSAFSLGAYALASQEPEWEDETPDRKLMYDIFYTPAGRIYLPRPFEFGTFFGALPVFMLDALRSQQGAQDLHKGAIQALLSTFGFNPIPQAVQPLLEVAFNYDSFRMRPLESQGMEQLPVAERKTEQTSTVAKVVSGAISAVDEAVLPQGSRLEISPVKAQRLIEGYTGSIGTMMLAAIDGLLGAVGAIPEKPGGVFGSPSSPTGMAATIAGVGRFFRADEEFTSRFVGDFYTAKRTADQIHKSFTEALLTGDRDRAQRIVADNRPALAARSMMEGVERQMSLLSQQMRAVAERDDMTQDQRREVLARYRQMRNDLSKRAVQAAQAVQ